MFPEAHITKTQKPKAQLRKPPASGLTPDKSKEKEERIQQAPGPRASPRKLVYGIQNNTNKFNLILTGTFPPTGFLSSLRTMKANPSEANPLA